MRRYHVWYRSCGGFYKSGITWQEVKEEIKRYKGTTEEVVKVSRVSKELEDYINGKS